MTEKEEQLARLISGIEKDRIVLCTITQTLGIAIILFSLFRLQERTENSNIVWLSTIFVVVIYFLLLYFNFFRKKEDKAKYDDLKFIEIRCRFAIEEIFRSCMALVFCITLFLTSPIKLSYSENILFLSTVGLVVCVSGAFLSIRYYLTSSVSKNEIYKD
ncbi:hypothetical protein ACETRX_36985 [Labrys portucalensis]|uniref:DUF3278 domain-containing protein n=1 Tax=Labrys neptuniae TaxID=376174 RepID=A0ABV6ZSJ6_9HYPH